MQSRTHAWLAVLVASAAIVVLIPAALGRQGNRHPPGPAETSAVGAASSTRAAGATTATALASGGTLNVAATVTEAAPQRVFFNLSGERPWVIYRFRHNGGGMVRFLRRPGDPLQVDLVEDQTVDLVVGQELSVFAAQNTAASISYELIACGD